ncbi:MAG: NADH-quinone oxidoreductase subunit NuoK [Dehalococcoidia bacterium]|nr:NADH-quinone oxidoreductase subunit NuoK [Dehalococcoidia bacterium]
MTLSNILILSALVFLIGLFGTLTKKSAVIVIMSLELMFNSVALSFVAFSRFAPGGFLGVESASRVLSGHIMAIFIIAIGAAEAALALSLVIALYREKSSIELTNSVDVREF